MTHIFVDTDVLLDFIGDRKPFSKFARLIFAGVNAKKFKAYTSSNSITTVYYLLSKIVDKREARILIMDLLDFVQVIPVSESILRKSIKSVFIDFEDAVQHQCALSIDSINFIVTRNLRDFRKSAIRAIGPEELVA